MGILALATIGFWPLFFLFVFFALICSLLIFFILMQKGKGEGLAGLLGGVSAADGMGTPEAQKELSTYTVWLSTIFFLMCLVLTVVASRCGGPIETGGPISGESDSAAGMVPEGAAEEPEALTVEEPEAVEPAEVEAPAATPEAVEEIDLSELISDETETPDVPEPPVEEPLPAEPVSPEDAAAL